MNKFAAVKTAIIFNKPKQKKTKPVQSDEFIVGLFGIIYPKDYRYKISNECELEEVNWLIKEGVFDSIDDYEVFTTHQLLNQLK